MEDILALQEALKQAQAVDSVHRLSEFNCIEIVNKLIEAELINVMYTTNGKEYITPDQLQREIKDELMASGGRINTVELPGLLNVDMPFIEKNIVDVLNSDREIKLLEGELVASYYLDDCAMEIQESLVEHGSLALTALAKQYNFTTQFITDMVTSRLGGHIEGHVTQGVLYTEAYVQRHAAQVRGLFSAVTHPVNLYNFATAYHLQPELALKTMKDLISEKRIDGLLRGVKGASMYLPSVYSNAQREAVMQFFQSNQYIAYEKLERLQVQSDPKTYLRNLFKDGHCLDSVYVSTPLLDQVDAACEDLLDNGAWCDVLSLVPTTFTEQDVAALVPLLGCVKRDKTVLLLGDRFVVSPKYVSHILDHFKDHAQKNVKGHLAKTSQTVNQVVQDKPVQSSKGSKQRASGGGDDDDDDWSMSNKKKGKGKKNKGRGGGGGGGSGGGAKSEKPSKTAQAAPNNSFMSPSVEEVRGLVTSGDKDIDECLAELLGVELKPKLVDIRKKAIDVESNSQITSARGQSEDFSKRIEGLFLDANVYAKGVALLQDVDSDGVVAKHLRKGILSDMVNSLVEYQGVLCLPQTTPVTNTQERQAMIKKLPSDVVDVLQPALTSLSTDEASVFLEKFAEVAQACQVMLKCDKKQLRNHTFTLRMQLVQAIESGVDDVQNPAQVVFNACSLLINHGHGCLVTGPGRIIPLLLTKLESVLIPEVHVSLTRCYDSLVKQLQAGDDISGEDKLELSKTVDSLLPEIKKLCLDKKSVAK